METLQTVLVFSVLHVHFVYKTVETMLKQAMNMWAEKGLGLNCHGVLCAEMAMGRIDQRLTFAAKIFDSQ